MIGSGEKQGLFRVVSEKMSDYSVYSPKLCLVYTKSMQDDHLRYLLVRRLYRLARWEEAAALWPPTRPCESRDACLTAIYSARALARIGLEVEAAG